MASNNFSCNTALIDLLFNMLVGFVALFILAFAMQAQEKRPKDETNVKSRGDMTITLSWPDDADDDMDLWVQDPHGNLVFFARRDAPLMYLDRDDLGVTQESVRMEDGTTQQAIGNQETVVVKKVIPGEYVINVHAYWKQTAGPLPVLITVNLINPRVEVLRKQIIVDVSGQEITAARLIGDETGGIKYDNDRSKSLIREEEMR